MSYYVILGVLFVFFCIVVYVVALAPWHLSHCRQRPPPHGGRRGAPGKVSYNCCFIIFINKLSYLSIVFYCLILSYSFSQTFSKHFPSSMTTSDYHSDSSHESCSNLPFSCHCGALIVLARAQTGNVAPVVMLPEDCQSIHICRKMRLRSKDVERCRKAVYTSLRCAGSMTESRREMIKSLARGSKGQCIQEACNIL